MTGAENQRPARYSVPMHLVAGHPVASYLVLAFTFAWGGMLPLLLSESGFGVLPFALPWQPFTAVPSLLGLAPPAFLVTAASHGRAGVRDLLHLHRLLRWRVGFHWYLVALFGLLAVTLVAAVPFPFLRAVPLEVLNLHRLRQEAKRERLGDAWPRTITALTQGKDGLDPVTVENDFVFTT